MFRLAVEDTAIHSKEDEEATDTIPSGVGRSDKVNGQDLGYHGGSGLKMGKERIGMEASEAGRNLTMATVAIVRTIIIRSNVCFATKFSLLDDSIARNDSPRASLMKDS